MSKSRPIQRLTLPHGSSPSQPAPPSLPLATDGSTDASTTQLDAMPVPDQVKRNFGMLPAQGVRYEKAKRVMELRQLGLDYDAIATEIGSTYGYVKALVYTAGKNRWFQGRDWQTTKERIDNDLIPRALDSLSALINHKNDKIRLEATVETLKGTAFKDYDQHTAPVQQTIVGIRLEMPPGPKQEMREGVLEAAPAYEAEIVESE